MHNIYIDLGENSILLEKQKQQWQETR